MFSNIAIVFDKIHTKITKVYLPIQENIMHSNFYVCIDTYNVLTQTIFDSFHFYRFSNKYKSNFIYCTLG